MIHFRNGHWNCTHEECREDKRYQVMQGRSDATAQTHLQLLGGLQIQLEVIEWQVRDRAEVYQYLCNRYFELRGRNIPQRGWDDTILDA